MSQNLDRGLEMDIVMRPDDRFEFVLPDGTRLFVEQRDDFSIIKEDGTVVYVHPETKPAIIPPPLVMKRCSVT